MTKTFALATLVAGSLLAGNTALQAQDSTNTPAAHVGGPGMRGRPNLDQIAKELSLTDDQKAKLKTAFEDQQKKLRSLREDTSVAPEDKKAKAKEIREVFQTSLKSILTPEQLTKWQQRTQRNRPAGGAGGTPPSTTPPQ